jgi:hypothetical protein
MEKIKLKIPLEKSKSYFFTGRYFSDSIMLLSSDFYTLTNKEFSDLYEKGTPFKCSFDKNKKKFVVVTENLVLPDVDKLLSKLLSNKRVAVAPTGVAIFSSAHDENGYNHLYCSKDTLEHLYIASKYDAILLVHKNLSLYGTSSDSFPMLERNAMIAMITVPHKEKMLEEVFVCCVMPIKCQNAFLDNLFSSVLQKNQEHRND